MSQVLELSDIQGLVARGYGSLRHAAYVVLHVDDPTAARPLLRRWVDQVTPADVSAPHAAMQLALTAAGVATVCPDAMQARGLSEQFVGGMVTSHRSRLLGDVESDDPKHWAWGGPATDPVHIMVLLYAFDDSALQAQLAALVDQAGSQGMRVVAQLGTDELSDLEPFGFRDGVSQPRLEGLPRARGSSDVVRAGEFVLGYVNEYGQRAERPLLAADADPRRVLPRDPDGSGGADLGRNGSYLVFRQLSQDVEGFWDYVNRQAPRGMDGVRLGAKLVGRWPGGAPLVLAPDHDDPALARANDFGYHASDPLGHACPLGAHVRRANPRDSLEPAPGTERSREVNRRHRLLRRGRNWSGPVAPGHPAERGIHFVCLNTSLSRQYEFVQHSWVNDPSFNGLYEASDPIVGPRHRGGATFEIQAAPLRARLHDLPQFVHVRGGAYFWLPGIRALRYLASGGAGDPPA